MFKSNQIKALTVAMVLVGLGFSATTAFAADHSLGGFHWARTSNPLIIGIGKKVSKPWVRYLNLASRDWSQSAVIDTIVVSPKKREARDCSGTLGRVNVCNDEFGVNGWLGLASVSVNNNGHITEGVVVLNDSYFNMEQFNTPAWKQYVMCQEIGHTLGLDHQDVIFDNPNLDTCMDYTGNPTTNTHPNLLDYQMLESVYAHLDSENTVSSIPKKYRTSRAITSKAEWGKELKKSKNGQTTVFKKTEDQGEIILTYVIWAE